MLAGESDTVGDASTMRGPRFDPCALEVWMRKGVDEMPGLGCAMPADQTCSCARASEMRAHAREIRGHVKEMRGHEREMRAPKHWMGCSFYLSREPTSRRARPTVWMRARASRFFGD